MEDTYAMSDIVSGPGTGGVPPSYTGVLSGIQLFSYSLSTNNQDIVTPMQVSHGTFSLQPYGLQNESVNHASIENQYAVYFNEPPVVSDNGSTYFVQQWPVKFEHMYGRSGGMVYTGQSYQNSLAFTQNQAFNAAQDFVNGTFGLPGDAVLTSVLERWALTPKLKSSVPTGYEFIWTHSDGRIGGDAIKVMVDDFQTSTQTCTETGIIGNDPNQGPIKGCIAWTTTYHDQPDISYAYRLWRKLTTANAPNQAAGSASIDAVAASNALPAGAVITAYRIGLWMPTLMQNSSLGARAAWIFTLGGTQQVAVDAHTGKVLGSVGYW
jgi:hypothetical protein